MRAAAAEWTEISLIAGSATPGLAHAVAGRLGLPLVPREIARFPDGELAVELGESVRGRSVVILQSTAPPVNDHLMELLALADSCRRGAARRITAVVPYFGYARADRREGRRVPVMARLVADLIEQAGITHLLTVNAHTAQLGGFFRIPVDLLTAVPVLSDAVRSRRPELEVVVSPDLGGVKLAAAYGRRLGLPVAVCQKRRLDGSSVEVSQVIGEVRGRSCLLVDDMITTGGTIEAAARALWEAGAREELAVTATHGVFAPGALERLAAAGLQDITVSDSVSPGDEASHEGVRVASLAAVLATAIRHAHGDPDAEDPDGQDPDGQDPDGQDPDAGS